ncbi:hypothetical protein HCN44_007941 [Aphidius gifuensis]|uniref:Uncharacterized protein n=1 Tax=Aphidius gifuensis TaxID=684658 RepID=A0A835CMG6_APHGI|nr:hypothetical protein HCN44_007941 [Aphidius gifuensis]
MKPRIRNNSLGPHFRSIGPKRIRKPKKIFTPASDKKRTLNEVNLKKVRALKKKKNNSRLKIDFSEDFSDQENDQIESTRTETVNALKNLVLSQNESDVSFVDRINHDSGENLNSSNLEDESQAGRHNDERFSRESNQASSLDQDTSINKRRSQSHYRLLYQSDDGDYDCDVDSPGESSRNSQLDHDAIRQSLASRKASSLDRETERGSRSPSLIQLNDNNDGDGDLETLSRPDQERRMIRNHQILKNQQNNTYDLETPVRSNQERTMSRNRPVNDVVEQPNTPRKSESFDDDYSTVEVDNDRFQMYGADYEHAPVSYKESKLF